jgi:hypothetical protein
MLKEATYYSRMAWHWGKFVRMPAIQDPQKPLREQLARREENFVELLRTAIFENPRTPYHDLFQLAQCTFSDLQTAVRKNGIEATLKELRDAGVHLTHEEVKGGTVVRHGKEIRNDAAATGNPNAPAGMETVSGGSRSKGLATSSSNEYRYHREHYELLSQINLGVMERVAGVLMAILPSPAALTGMAGYARMGRPADRWFVVGRSAQKQAIYAAATRFMVAEANLLGRRIPFPEFLQKDDFLPVARWIGQHKQQGRNVFLRTGPSSATRVCTVAQSAGIDISGTSILTSGEAISPARRKVLEASGVETAGRYVISELGSVGIGCTKLQGNSVHLFSDSIAAIVHRRPAPYVDADVNSLLLTSVSPYASRVLINADMEDAATLTTSTCGCLFHQTGFTTVLQDVYSFGKLSGHASTLAGEVLLTILEERMPARFGGHPGDYQLVEKEAESQLELELRVSSRTGAADVAALKEYFLEQVRSLYGGNLTARTWEASSALKVVIAEPHKTRSGKVHALHLSAFGGHKA